MDVRRLGLSDEDLEALGYRVAGKARTGSAATTPGPTPTATRGDGAGRAWFWTLAILVAAGWLALPARRMPAPVPANQPHAVFSSARAMSQLVEIARAPRPTGSPEHARVRDYVASRLRALGLEVVVQTDTAVDVRAGAATSAVLHNVLARRGGTSPTGALVLTAHYDGVPLSLGAGDDGIGIAAILETVRALQADRPLRNDLIVVVTDGAELGSLGARAFLEGHPWRADMDVVLSIDPRGVSGPALLLEELDSNEALVDAAARALPSPASNSTLRALEPWAEEQGDLRAFAEAGIPALGFTSYGGGASYHRATDEPINVSEATLQHHGAQLLAAVRAFGAADLGADLVGSASSRTYFSLPLVGLVAPPMSWTTVATAGLFLGWVLLGLLFWLRGRDPRLALAGLALGVGVTGASAGLGWGLLELLRRLHPEVGRLETAVYHEAGPAIALVGLVVAAGVGAYAIARLRFDRRELLLGSLLVPLGVTAWLTFAAPYAATSLQVPLGLALLAAIARTVATPVLASGRWMRMAVLAASVAILLFVVPALDILVGVLTLREAPLIGGAMGVATLLLLPIFDWLVRPRAWLTPAVATTAALVAVGVSLPAVQGDLRHPVPTSLVLLVDDTLAIGEPAAFPATTTAVAGRLSLGPSDLVAMDDGGTSERAMRWLPGRWLTVPGVGEEWARSWVVGPKGAGEAPGPLLLPASADWVVAGTGAEARVARPELEVLRDMRVDGRRVVGLRIWPGLDAEMVGVRLVDGIDGSVTAVAGRAVESPAGDPPVRALTHWGGSDGGALDLELSAADGAALAFDLIEHQLRPAEVLGERFFEREDSVVADASTGSDRLIQRVRIHVPPP